MARNKRQIKREIDDCEKEIEALEQKRERSQVAVMRAWIDGTKPSAEDAQYFSVFSSLIDQKREELRRLYIELDSITKKKK